MLSSHLLFGLPSGFFLSVFFTKTLHAPLPNACYMSRPSHSSLFDQPATVDTMSLNNLLFFGPFFFTLCDVVRTPGIGAGFHSSVKLRWTYTLFWSNFRIISCLVRCRVLSSVTPRVARVLCTSVEETQNMPIRVLCTSVEETQNMPIRFYKEEYKTVWNNNSFECSRESEKTQDTTAFMHPNLRAEESVANWSKNCIYSYVKADLLQEEPRQWCILIGRALVCACACVCSLTKSWTTDFPCLNAVVAFRQVLRKSPFAQVGIVYACVQSCMYVEGKPVEIHTPQHTNIVGLGVTAPSPALSPSSILPPPSSADYAFIPARKKFGAF